MTFLGCDCSFILKLHTAYPPKLLSSARNSPMLAMRVSNSTFLVLASFFHLASYYLPVSAATQAICTAFNPASSRALSNKCTYSLERPD